MNESRSADYHVLILPCLVRGGRAGAVAVGGMGDVEHKENKKTVRSILRE